MMATGIVALALDAAGWRAGGRGLFWVATTAYGLLWVLTIAWCIRDRVAVQAGLLAHTRAPLGEFFAWVSLAAWALTAVGLVRHLFRTRPAQTR